GGDFTQIAEAVAAVAAGDVLLVEPGTYEGFALTKRLTILGRAGGPRPHVTGDVRLQASSFTLAGFDMDLVHVTDVSGRGHIDDCKVKVAQSAEFPSALTVLNCAELVISRTTVVGESDYTPLPLTIAGTGMTIQASRVTLVQCTAYGGWGDDETWEFPGGPYTGGAGLHVTDGSDVVLAGTSVFGGYGGWAFGFYSGAPGGPAVSVTGSTVRIRGDSTDELRGGEPGQSSTAYGAAIKATGSTVVSSGLQYTKGGFSMSSSLFIQPSVAEPFLATSGATTPGATCSVELHGPPDATALLAASLEPALVALPAFEGQLWLNPSALLVLIPIIATGQDTPVVLNVSLPRSLAGLEGTCFELQVFFPSVPGALDPGKKFAGNVAELILRL
ncbi:MAG TPA: hypothetical protein VFD43_10795, partial [Planctomycetota bacterium]|nr:hypothetical protein [Planctomycetota bacterium]